MYEANQARPLTKVAKHYEGLSRGVILASRCTKCNMLYLPPRADCAKCYSSEMTWEDVTTVKGFLLTFTTIYFAPKSFEGHVPYTVAVVQLDNGLRIIGWVEEQEGPKLKIGDTVKVVTHEFDDGRLGLKVVGAE